MSLTGILPNAVTFQMIMEVFKIIELAMRLIPPQDLAKFGDSTESQRVLGALQLLQVLPASTSLFRIGEVRVQRLRSPAMTRYSTTSWTCQVQTCLHPFLTPCPQLPKERRASQTPNPHHQVLRQRCSNASPDSKIGTLLRMTWFRTSSPSTPCCRGASLSVSLRFVFAGRDGEQVGTG